MKRILAPILLMVLLFPTLAFGETVDWSDLVHRDGLYYKKFTDVPFDGKVTGQEQGSFRDGITARYRWNPQPAVPWSPIFRSGLLVSGEARRLLSGALRTCSMGCRVMSNRKELNDRWRLGG